ncbi:MAG: protein jag [Spirochaetaceae bacterium]|jgi:spoIIIJ-associated protein|nr:protein jag [Spirochaetaceae bacterium]
MTYDFEGKTEKEAIERAMLELGVERDSFDVEILEVQRGGLFKKGFVRIRLHLGDEAPHGGGHHYPAKTFERRSAAHSTLDEAMPADEEFERLLLEFVTIIIEKMNISGKVTVQSREKRKITLNVETAHSAIVIGKKGRTLDALQLIATLYTKKIHRGEMRVILDCENYRLHHEEILVRLAYSVAAKVRLSRRSILLEPMNPYDRRLIHTTLDKAGDIETKSEGEGVYKQVRVSFRSPRM